MRICIVNEFFHPDSTGGTGAVLSSLARALRGHYEVEIDVLTGRSLYRGTSGPLPSDEDWDGVHITRLASPRPHGLPPPLRLGANLLFAGAALLTLLRRRRYDLLVVSTAPPVLALAAQLLKWLTGTPYLYIVYDLEPDCATALGLLRRDHPLAHALRRCQRSWLHAAGRTVVLGRCMRDHLGRAYGLPAHRAVVIPIGADPGEIVPRPKDTQFRRRHGLGGFLVCYSGNFGRCNDFDTILDAARRLQTLREDVTFVLVGDGAQKTHIARRVADEGLHSVRLFPFVPQDEYADLLASADVSLVTLEAGMEGLCVPSKFYSTLASGRPTIAIVSPRSEVALVLAEAGCGIHLPEGDTDSLVEAVCRLAAQPEECERMGHNARHALVHHYSLSRIAAQYYAAMCAAIADTAGQTERSYPRLTPSPIVTKKVWGSPGHADVTPRSKME